MDYLERLNATYPPCEALVEKTLVSVENIDDGELRFTTVEGEVYVLAGN